MIKWVHLKEDLKCLIRDWLTCCKLVKHSIYKKIVNVMNKKIKKGRVLIAEESVIDVARIKKILGDDLGTIAAMSGVDALEFAKGEVKPDIILLGMKFPDMDGFELLESLKADDDTKNIPVISIIPDGDDIDEQRGLNLGALDFIRKPYSAPIIKKRVENHIRLKKYADRLNRLVDLFQEEMKESMMEYDGSFLIGCKAINERILMVDDSIEQISSLAESLKKDYSLLIVTTLDDALNLAGSSKPPDIILLSASMPDMQAFEICRKLKENDQTANIPVIFIADNKDMSTEVKGLEAGAVDYIRMSMSMAMIKARVRNYIEIKKYFDHLKELLERFEEELQRIYKGDENPFYIGVELN